jgi:hypothetical protein
LRASTGYAAQSLQRCIDIAHGACSLAATGDRDSRATEKVMFYIGDLFQWERFITPSIIKLFYWLVVIIVILSGLSGLVTALGTLALNPIAAAFTALASFAGMLVGILFARIAAEFILMVFRINEHLAAIRNRAGM